MTRTANSKRLDGLLAEFDTPEELLHAAEQSRAKGYREMDGYSPFQVEGLAEVVGFEKNPVAGIVLAGGVTGCIVAYLLQWYTNGVNYPIEVAARPLNSIPAWVPIVFELTVLFASLASFLGVLFLNGLPRLWRPIFAVERFRRASKDGFFLWIAAKDSAFDRDATTVFLRSLGARGVYEVER